MVCACSRRHLTSPASHACAPSGCRKNHLIADNLGWFQDGGTNVEQIMQEKGLAVTRVRDPSDADGAESQSVNPLLLKRDDDSVFEAHDSQDAKK